MSVPEGQRHKGRMEVFVKAQFMASHTARILKNPKVFDPAIDEELIRRINRETGITVIVITHQMSVVQEICNRVAILENGTVVEEGEVSEIFSRPRTAAARALVFPETAEEVSELVEGSQILRIIFNGASAAREPLIAKMAVECGIMAGIIGASTRSIGDRAYGYMLLEIPGTPEDLARAVTYLSGIPDIVTQVEAEYGKEEKE